MTEPEWAYYKVLIGDSGDGILFRMEHGVVERLDPDGWHSTEGETIRRGVAFGEPSIIRVDESEAHRWDKFIYDEGDVEVDKPDRS